jgi:hypothetical protein
MGNASVNRAKPLAWRASRTSTARRRLGTPPAATGAPSKKDGYYNYINIGVYTEAMKADQIRRTAAGAAGT